MGLLEIILHGREKAQVNATVIDRCDLADLTDTDHAEYRFALSAIDDFSRRKPCIKNAKITPSVNQTVYSLTDIDPEWDPETFSFQHVKQYIDHYYTDDAYDNEQNYRITYDYISEQHILKFIRNWPSGDFGVQYSRPHKIITPIDYPTHPITTTISSKDEETVGFLLASKLLDAAASKAAEFNDTMGDNIDLKNVMDKYVSRAQYFLAEYEKRSSSRNTGGPVWVSTPLESPFGMRPIHPSHIYG